MSGTNCNPCNEPSQGSPCSERNATAVSPSNILFAETFACLNVASGATLLEVVRKVNEAFCGISQGNRIAMAVEPQGSNCANGGIKVSILNSVNQVISSQYVCNGTDGTNGNTILSGSIYPADSVGEDGDFYINLTAKVLMGPKTAGAWTGSLSLVGPQGELGTPGANTLHFLYGDQGTSGNINFTDPDLQANASLLINKTSVRLLNGSAYPDNNAVDWLTGVVLDDIIQVYQVEYSANFAIYKVTGVASNSTYFQFSVTLVAGSGTVTSGDKLAVSYIPHAIGSGGMGSTATSQILITATTVTPLRTDATVRLTALASNVIFQNIVSPVDQNPIRIEIKGDSIVRTISFGTKYEFIDTPITETTPGKWVIFEGHYNVSSDTVQIGRTIVQDTPVISPINYEIIAHKVFNFDTPDSITYPTTQATWDLYNGLRIELQNWVENKNYELQINKVVNFTTVDNTTYPTTLATETRIELAKTWLQSWVSTQGFELTVNKAINFNILNDTKFPTNKAVWDRIEAAKWEAQQATQDWVISQGFEVVSNKVTDFSIINNTTYPTTSAIEVRLSSLSDTSGTIQVIVTAASVVPLATDRLIRVTALAQNMTVANMTPTTDGKAMYLQLKDDGTARTFTLGTGYEWMFPIIPATTPNKWTTLKLLYNSTVSKWQVLEATIQDNVVNITGAEMIINKATDFTTINHTKYPTVQAVKEYVDSQGITVVEVATASTLEVDFSKGVYRITELAEDLDLTGFTNANIGHNGKTVRIEITDNGTRQNLTYTSTDYSWTANTIQHTKTVDGTLILLVTWDQTLTKALITSLTPKAQISTAYDVVQTETSASTIQINKDTQLLVVDAIVSNITFTWEAGRVAGNRIDFLFKDDGTSRNLSIPNLAYIGTDKILPSPLVTTVGEWVFLSCKPLDAAAASVLVTNYEIEGNKPYRFANYVQVVSGAGSLNPITISVDQNTEMLIVNDLGSNLTINIASGSKSKSLKILIKGGATPKTVTLTNGDYIARKNTYFNNNVFTTPSLQWLSIDTSIIYTYTSDGSGGFIEAYTTLITDWAIKGYEDSPILVQPIAFYAPVNGFLEADTTTPRLNDENRPYKDYEEAAAAIIASTTLSATNTGWIKGIPGQYLEDTILPVYPYISVDLPIHFIESGFYSSNLTGTVDIEVLGNPTFYSPTTEVPPFEIVGNAKIRAHIGYVDTDRLFFVSKDAYLHVNLHADVNCRGTGNAYAMSARDNTNVTIQANGFDITCSQYAWALLSSAANTTYTGKFKILNANKLINTSGNASANYFIGLYMQAAVGAEITIQANEIVYGGPAYEDRKSLVTIVNTNSNENKVLIDVKKMTANNAHCFLFGFNCGASNIDYLGGEMTSNVTTINGNQTGTDSPGLIFRAKNAIIKGKASRIGKQRKFIFDNCKIENTDIITSNSPIFTVDSNSGANVSELQMNNCTVYTKDGNSSALVSGTGTGFEMRLFNSKGSVNLGTKVNKIVPDTYNQVQFMNGI